MSGKYERKKEIRTPKGGKKKNKALVIALSVVLGLILLVVIAGVILYNYSMSKIKKVDVPKVNYTSAATEPEITTAPTQEETETTEATTEETTEPTEPHVASRDDYINFLIVGQDAREGEEGALADTMIVCTLNTYEKTLTLTSVLRDTRLLVSGTYTDTKGTVHTYGGGKVNMIYAEGYKYSVADAMGWLNQALYDNFGLEIDHNFEVDFDAFVKVIDILGGIDIEMTQAEVDWMNDDGKVFQEISLGVNHLDGDSALAYARMRKAQGDQGDITRSERQRKVITAVLSQLKTLDLSTVQKLIDEVLPCVTTSMSTSEITAMIAKLLPMLKDLTITSSGTCPHKYGNDRGDIMHTGQIHEYLTFVPGEVKKYMRALTLGEGTIE